MGFHPGRNREDISLIIAVMNALPPCRWPGPTPVALLLLPACGGQVGTAEPAPEDPGVPSPDAVAIRAAGSALPPRQAQGIVVRFYLQLAGAETAEGIRGGDAAVKSLTQRGLSGLRVRLQLTDAATTPLEVEDVAQ